MRIVWHSNSPLVGSGYGSQTAMFAERLHRAGHEVIVSCNYGLNMAKISMNGIEVLPAGYTDHSEDTLPAHWAHYQPDVLVTLYDIWVFSREVLGQVPVTAWTPVDHDPIPPGVTTAAKLCAGVWAMSRFGERELKRVGVECAYVPHGVDTDVYTPIGQSEARRMLGIDEDCYLVTCVAANKGWPSRKNLPQLLAAWGTFARAHPGAKLWLHSNMLKVHSGLDLEVCADFYGVPKESIIYPDVYRLMRGDYGLRAMNALYNSADLFVLPSAGEGFGIPAIEAAAAGCPVALTTFTAQAELVGPGFGIGWDQDDLMYTLANSEHVMVRPSRIIEALEWGLEHKGDQALRQAAREFAMQYDADRVFREYMLPALEAQAERQREVRAIVEEREARTAARRALGAR